MTLFDIIRDTCNKSTCELVKDTTWDDVDVSTYMYQRWLSMTNPDNAEMVAMITNLGFVEDVDKDFYYYLYSAFAFKSYGRFKYLKPKRKEKEEEVEITDNFNLSSRERDMYNELLDELNKD